MDVNVLHFLGRCGFILFCILMLFWIFHDEPKEIKKLLAQSAESASRAGEDARKYVEDLTHTWFKSHTTFSLDRSGNITAKTTLIDAMDEYRIVMNVYGRLSGKEQNNALVERFFGDYHPLSKNLQNLIYTLESDDESPENMKIPIFPIGDYTSNAKYDSGDLAFVRRKVESLGNGVHVGYSSRGLFLVWVNPPNA